MKKYINNAVKNFKKNPSMSLRWVLTLAFLVGFASILIRDAWFKEYEVFCKKKEIYSESVPLYDKAPNGGWTDKINIISASEMEKIKKEGASIDFGYVLPDPFFSLINQFENSKIYLSVPSTGQSKVSIESIAIFELGGKTTKVSFLQHKNPPSNIGYVAGNVWIEKDKINITWVPEPNRDKLCIFGYFVMFSTLVLAIFMLHIFYQDLYLSTKNPFSRKMGNESVA
jgi:hypothetical protein